MANKWTPQQEAAMQDYGKSLLVSAAAGSGKTSVLTERIIRRLTDREHPADLSRMLVVTFTRASAADLKSKIAKALSSAIAKNPQDRHLTKQLLTIGSAQISTIDSFFQKAVRTNFDELDLPASFRTVDTAEILPLSLGILDSLLENHYEKASVQKDPKDPLSRIKQNAFADAMDHVMSGRSDGKTDLLLLKLYNRFSSYPQGIAILHHFASMFAAEAQGEFFASMPGKAVHGYLFELFRSYLHFLNDISEQTKTDPDLYMKLGGLLSSDMDFCDAMMRALNNTSYEEARTVAHTFVKGRFPKLGSEVPDFVFSYKTWRNDFKEKIEKTVQHDLQWPAEMIPVQFEKTALFCETLYQFYIDFEAKLLAEKKARGILEYNDIRSALYKLLSNADGTPTPAARSMAAQYDEVYIDEYQDVDFLQDSIFAQIGGNRRFMVGDIKQSIYGFRGSEPSVFASYRRAYPLYTESTAKNADGVCVFMSNNFRCNEPVIDFTNKICAFLFSACRSSIGYQPEDDLVFSKQANKASAPVTVAVFDAKPRKSTEDDAPEKTAEEALGAEAVWVANEIARLLKEEHLDNGDPVTPADIAILVRAKSHGIPFAKALEQVGIPVMAEAASGLMQEPLMITVLNLLRAIDNPYRDLPLSEYLLSSFGGFSLEELTEIRMETPDRKSLYDAMEAKATCQDPSPLQQKALGFYNWMENMRENAAILSADRLLRLLYADDKWIEHQDEPVLLYLYEQARNYQRTSFYGLYAFLDVMTKLQSSEKVSADGFLKAERSVTIMSVHHSKGLEFPVVFLCASGKGFIKDAGKSALLFHRNVGCATKLYQPELGECEESILRIAAQIEIETEQAEENIRTLYVALTRARERLYVTGTLPGSHATALASAALVKRHDRTSILGCNSYLAWILAALQEKSNQDKSHYTILYHSHIPEQLNTPVSSQSDAEGTKKPSSNQSVDPLAAHYAEIVKAHESFVYPLDFLRGLPTKAAASKLSPDLLDRLSDMDDEDSVSETQLDLMASKQPSFDELLAAHQKPTAADIGTATHAFLEFCDFAHFAKNGIDAECSRLLTERFLSETTAGLLDKAQLEAFRNSNLMEWILSAKTILREQKFNLLVPFDELTSTPREGLADHTLFVQGSIDLLIETADGEWILVDYKTDRLQAGEKNDVERFRRRMKAAHGNQLSYYQRAVRELFGALPVQTYLYSLPLGTALEM